MLDLGTIVVVRHGDGVYIRDCVNGEAGQFSLDEFRAVVEKFFAEKF